MVFCVSSENPAARGGVDPAVRKARAVVGLYGDPTAAWGICVELTFAAPLDAEKLQSRLAKLCDEHRYLGKPPAIDRAAASTWSRVRAELAATPFRDDAPLVRVALDDSARRVLVGAHHGVCDGLGLLAIGDALTGAGIESAARGIGGRESPQHFLRSSAARLLEAILRPPARFGGTPSGGSTATEHLETLVLPAQQKGTVELCSAIAYAFADWTRVRPRRSRLPVLVIGASRRGQRRLTPDRQTAYLRLRFEPTWPVDRFRTELGRVEPEPAFPETSAGGIGPRITHLLRNRLGSTAIVSNLGIISGTGLESVAMFPAASGPAAVAIGFASTEHSTTLTIRTRTADYTPDEARDILAAVARHLTGVEVGQYGS